MKHLFLIALILIAGCAKTGTYGNYSGDDKQAHKLLFGGGTLVAYPLLRSQDVEYSAEIAAGSMFVAGVIKEHVFDPSPLNKHPTKPSSFDIRANAIGIGAAYGFIKVGEWMEGKYDFNPFYWRW